MASMTFGRYTFRETYVHHLDARNKIFLMIDFIHGGYFLPIQYVVHFTCLKWCLFLSFNRLNDYF